MKGNERKRKRKAKAASNQQPAIQQYIYQCKIQSVVPNTFSNKESIAHKESLHNPLKKFSSYPSIAEAGRFTNHFPALFITFGAQIIYFPSLYYSLLYVVLNFKTQLLAILCVQVTWDLHAVLPITCSHAELEESPHQTATPNERS